MSKCKKLQGAERVDNVEIRALLKKVQIPHSLRSECHIMDEEFATEFFPVGTFSTLSTSAADEWLKLPVLPARPPETRFLIEGLPALKTSSSHLKHEVAAKTKARVADALTKQGYRVIRIESAHTESKTEQVGNHSGAVQALAGAGSQESFISITKLTGFGISSRSCARGSLGSQRGQQRIALSSGSFYLIAPAVCVEDVAVAKGLPLTESPSEGRENSKDTARFQVRSVPNRFQPVLVAVATSSRYLENLNSCEERLKRDPDHRDRRLRCVFDNLRSNS